MATRRDGRDDRWQTYPTSVPIKTEDGIATSKQRGAMADTWWSQRIVTLLDSYGLGARMQRGRRYARQGQLVSFAVEPGSLVAQVQGSRAQPYAVEVASAVLSDAQWSAIDAAMRARVVFAAQLLAGEVPPELEAVFESAGVALLPVRWADVSARCSCPDSENPCKHIAAVLYVFADQLDVDPWLLLAWRGRTRDQLLAHLRPATPSPERPRVAPWWPLVPGAALPERGLVDGLLGGPAPDDPAAALTRCGPLAIDVRSRPVAELLTPAYRAIVDETD